MFKSAQRIIVISLLAVSACANPSIDTSDPSFDKTQYALDLNACRGGTALDAALHGLGGAIVGSVYGATHGVFYGAIAGDAPDGAFIGAIAGGVIGIFAGAYEPIQEQAQSIDRCMRDRGYVG
jgi:hypothetical protein